MGQAEDSQHNSESAREFVRAFYDWYVPLTHKRLRETTSDIALRERRRAFGPLLFRALKEDSEAQDAAKELVVGLDFDPFLNTQDPCEGYRLGGVSKKGDVYRVEVYEVCPDRTQREELAVIAEAGLRNGRWVFLNFYYPDLVKDYPDSADLLAILKKLREDREKPR